MLHNSVDNIIQCLNDHGHGKLPEELARQEALDNYFDVRQGKAESILDYISVRKSSLLP